MKGRQRQHYIKLFNVNKDLLSREEQYLVYSTLHHLYQHSRVNSLDINEAKKMLKIHKIPASHIAHYTSKHVLENICKMYGLPYSGKKSTDLVSVIRTML